ncbi:DUF302 domain-containing protein [Ktedonospora formicarum]|uniref:DUF302 domain-containing protein n=1 Tax=Ktedonospora formicarum TaxID=2778364 RepID=A0A8J3HQL7_9CHLR|nr:DUF302 domain-containing protein [Ktedonospora formicarum]GHO42002.1 hypothetical protein KSX_01650 [Ktedonospora formicarum]
MSHTTHISIEHVVVASKRPYQQVIDALEARLGPVVNWDEILYPLMDAKVSWEQLTKECEAHIGHSGLTFFYKVGHSPYLTVLGKSSRATQYTIGNPLLASYMTRHTPEAALYAPFKLVVYQDEEDRTIVAYDNFASLLAQYQNEEINKTAQVVQQKLAALVMEAIGE